MARSDNYRKEINILKEECKVKFDEFIENSKKEVHEALLAISSINQNVNEIEEKNKEIDALHKSILAAYNDIYTPKNEDAYSLYEDVKISQEHIDNWYNEIEELHEKLFDPPEVTSKGEEISQEEANALGKESVLEEEGKFYEKVVSKPLTLVERNDAELERTKKALISIRADSEDSFNDKIKEYSEAIDEAKNKYDEIVAEIKALMPDATATGLSSAYDAAKEQHSQQVQFWNKVFFIAIGAMSVLPLCYVIYQLSSTGVMTSFLDIAYGVLRILPFELPLAYLAWQSIKKINQHTRLYSEYLHKWAVTRTFQGLRIATEELDDDGTQLSKLYGETLDSYANNPSATLDNDSHGKTPISETADGISKVLSAVAETGEKTVAAVAKEIKKVVPTSSD